MAAGGQVNHSHHCPGNANMNSQRSLRRRDMPRTEETSWLSVKHSLFIRLISPSTCCPPGTVMGFGIRGSVFPQITTHNLVIILLSGRAGSLLQRDPAEPEPTTSRWPRLLGWEDARRGTGWHAPGLEPPAAHPGREAVATVVQFGGESGLALQELLAGKPAVHPTVASICLSKFQLAGGETTFAGQAGLCLLSLMHLPGRFLTCICAHVCSLPL